MHSPHRDNGIEAVILDAVVLPSAAVVSKMEITESLSSSPVSNIFSWKDFQQ
jgi:hypothetical protein